MRVQHILSNWFGGWHALLFLGAMAPLTVLPLLPLHQRKQRRFEKKHPGLAAWATYSDVQLFHKSQYSREALPAGFLGQLVDVKPGKKYAATAEPLYLGEEAWCQNTVVQGGMGCGKTEGFFHVNGMLAADLGHTLVVIDTKWGRRDGMQAVLSYWNKAGRPVLLWTPREAGTLRLPIGEGITSLVEAQHFAAAILPAPEYREEPGEHYKNIQRLLLAVLARVTVLEGGTIEDLFQCTLMRLDDLKERIERIDTHHKRLISTPERAELKKVLNLLLARGDEAFANDLSAIIGRLDFFSFEHVARACSSGSIDDTIRLETALREPTLLYMGISPEDMMDDRLSVLPRLFLWRLMQAVFRVAGTTPDGKLPHLTTLMMDDLPSYGRVNFLMRMSATMRSYRFALIFSIHNSAQGRLVYGPDYWHAISENVISRRIVFPYGVSGADARDISQRLGNTTVLDESRDYEFDSAGQLLTRGVSGELRAHRLLPVEEFCSYGKGEAIVISSQHRPIRTLFTPVSQPTVTSSRVRPGTASAAHGLALDESDDAHGPRDFSQLTEQLVQGGVFRRLTPEQQQWNLEDAHGTRRLMEQAGSNGDAERVMQQFQNWAEQVIRQVVCVKIVTHAGVETIEIRVDTLSGETAEYGLFVSSGFLRSASNFTLCLTPMGRQVLTQQLLLEEFKGLQELYPAWDHLRRSASSIEGTPERAALPEGSRPDVYGLLERQGQPDEVLWLKFQTVSRLYGTAKHFASRRIQRPNLSLDATMYAIPLRNAALIREALSRDQD